MNRKTRLVLHAGWFTLLAVAVIGCSGESAKNTASTVTKKAVEVTKGTLTGIEKGVADGRKAAESADGALIVSNADELVKNLNLSFVSVYPHELDRSMTIDIGFENTTEKPVRVTGLQEKGNLLLLDQDGFSYEMNFGQAEVTVPPKAKVKAAYSFKGKVSSFAKIRVYGKDFAIPPEIEKKERPDKTSDSPTGKTQI